MVGLLLTLGLVACGEAQPPSSEAELGVQVWKSSETGAEVRAYEDCLHREAEATRPESDLGLERIDAVLASCKAEEDALSSAVETVWRADDPEQLNGRMRGVRIEALRVIRDSPYIPPIAIAPAD